MSFIVTGENIQTLAKLIDEFSTKLEESALLAGLFPEHHLDAIESELSCYQGSHIVGFSFKTLVTAHLAADIKEIDVTVKLEDYDPSY